MSVDNPKLTPEQAHVVNAMAEGWRMFLGVAWAFIDDGHVQNVVEDQTIIQLFSGRLIHVVGQMGHECRLTPTGTAAAGLEAS